MNDSLMAWSVRFAYSLIPVCVAVGSMVFGNSILEAIGEGSSTYLYLAVIFAVEICIEYAFQADGASLGTRSLWILELMLATILWIIVVFTRINAANAPSGQVPWSFIATTSVGVLLSYFVIRTHRRFSKDVSQQISKNQAMQIDQLEKKKPTKGKVGGKNFRV